MEPSQGLPEILERCRAHGIACPIDLVTARQPTSATLAWMDYVRELPLPEPPPLELPALADGMALTGFENISPASEEAWLEDERDRERERAVIAARARARKKSTHSSRVFMWALVVCTIIALAVGGALSWQRAQPIATLATPVPTSEMSAAFSLLEQHQPERAAAIFRAVLQRDPQRADAHYGLARVYFDQGKEEEALAEAQAALQKRENDPDTWLMLANASRRSGHLTLARQAYARTLALAPRQPHAEDIRAALRELDGQ